MHDERAISAEFRALAAAADDEYKALADAPGSPRHQDRDSVLARACVFGYLYDRHFLESAEMLLDELRWLQRSGRPRAPKHAGSVARFEQARDALLDSLVARFADASAR